MDEKQVSGGVGHTPGPWASSLVNVQRAITGPHGEPIAYTRAEWLGQREGTDEANARLIAASPTLLEALRELLAKVDAEGSAYCAEEADAAHAAIAKATGSEA